MFDCQSIYWVSKALWLEHWHSTLKALGLNLSWDLTFHHLLHLELSFSLNPQKLMPRILLRTQYHLGICKNKVIAMLVGLQNTRDDISPSITTLEFRKHSYSYASSFYRIHMMIIYYLQLTKNCLITWKK